MLLSYLKEFDNKIPLYFYTYAFKFYMMCDDLIIWFFLLLNENLFKRFHKVKMNIFFTSTLFFFIFFLFMNNLLGLITCFFCYKSKESIGMPKSPPPVEIFF